MTLPSFPAIDFDVTTTAHRKELVRKIGKEMAQGRWLRLVSETGLHGKSKAQ